MDKQIKINILLLIVLALLFSPVMIVGLAGRGSPTYSLVEVETVQEVVYQAQELVVDKPQMVSLGEFKITYYCSCKQCTGDGDGITASGTIATPNRTLGVDPEVIPLDTIVYINGQAYVAEDTGSGVKGNHIDMFVESHELALENGVDYFEVFKEE